MRSSKVNPTDRLLSIVGFLVVIFLAYWLLHADLSSGQNGSKPNEGAAPGQAASQQSNLYAVLTPATAPPKVAECNQSLSFNSNGTSGPLTCSNGDLNATEWQALATLEPTVFSLDYKASASQVQTALCNDVNVTQSDANTQNASLVEQNVYQIAALYYGWKFSTNPASVLTNGGC